nr:ABC transporter ATP-binding protein [Planctomycetota bacterium]
TGLCGGCENLSRRGIGYVSSDERSFFWRLSGRDNLLFFARLYGLTSKHGRARIEVLLKQFDFEKRADDLFKNYSAGMRKKVSIIRALMHQPSLLLLDEVTNSLDPESTAAVKKVIRQYVSAGQGRMAIWSTHRLEEMPEICDGFLIIDSGRIVSQGAIADFKSGFKGEKYFASCC